MQIHVKKRHKKVWNSTIPWTREVVLSVFLEIDSINITQSEKNRLQLM